MFRPQTRISPIYLQRIWKRSGHSLSKSPVLSNAEVRRKRNAMFDEERDRQKNLIPRIEKITVECQENEYEPYNCTLILNKDMSTPHHAALHINESIIERSALAVVNGRLWDFHRPLEEDCTLKFLNFFQDDPFHINRAFWRSCSFMLGAALETIFQEQYFVELHSFPPPVVQSGSFVHDVDLKIEDWTPSREELMSFSAFMHRMAEKELPFERLAVNASLALQMFSDNQYKSKQIPNIAENSKSGNKVTLYRAGDHIDISGGPMMANTSFLGRRCTITAAHKIDHEGKSMYRFQGVALPKGFFLDHYAYGLLEKRATRLNMVNLSGVRAVSPV